MAVPQLRLSLKRNCWNVSSHGDTPDEYLKRLAATLARIYYKADESQKKAFARLSHQDKKEL